MKCSPNSNFWSALAVLTAGILLSVPAWAQEVTQSVTLNPGWNSIWLEVEPTGADGYQKAPEVVFNNAAIEMIATPKPLSSTAEFFAEDPGTIGTFNQDGWQQWNKTDAPGTSDLTLVFGNRPYLIKVAQGTVPFSIPITGKVRFFRPTWTPDRYNLIGFGLQGTRTFNDFFGPSGTKHAVSKIFRLKTNGDWQLVNGSDTMVSNQAYWVFCNGASNYMGPVAVDFDFSSSGRLDFGGPSDALEVGPSVPPVELDLKEIVFTNLGTTSAVPELDLVAVTPGLGSLALFVVNPSSTGFGYVRGNQVDTSVAAGSSALGETVASQTTRTLSLGAQRNWTTGGVGRLNLYRVKTSATGASFYLPVTATLNNSEYTASTTPLSPASERTGLWIGEVIVDSATSIVENGAPVKPAAVKAPARIIIHYNGTTARLLSQVTLMQTKTADADVAPTPVLVVDPARIPFFEGIKERNGKRVGVRMESVAYDMPRKMDATSQAAILSDPAYPGLTAAGLPAFLVSRTVRPPSLKEVYALSVDLAGTLGASGTLSTISGSLHLDPFHRSNPFRHPYHHDHSFGPFIYRDLKIDFDSNQPLGDVLRGTYTETIKGLINSNLTLTGRVELRRVSTVATLEGTP
ncbi:hypothetical protein SAMN02745166_00105 [Prosthecobacter debontii]|uniref:Uncharacterized protein n=1 Tax=Prosthecobacter debontii TaxID=48467 RepID=A0A1T4WH73_9BACT|nr:hypothetical protein [Prosthecobacter debontii]SKA75991.1 hypothetical protein SAMN02745166_00105 [Prosthecobacter debontii]